PRPLWPLTREGGETSKVVVLVSTNMYGQDRIGAEKELANLLTVKLQEGCKANNEAVTVIPASRVQRFKEEHRKWQELAPREIGRYFRADYPIDLEIGTMTLFERGSANQLYRGNAELTVAVHDICKPGGEGLIFKTANTCCKYPRDCSVPV